MDKITFTAALAPSKNAVAFDGVDNCAEIKLQAPGTEVAEVAKLLLLTGKELKITVEEVVKDGRKTDTI